MLTINQDINASNALLVYVWIALIEYFLGKKSVWGERSFEAENYMPVMTYAGFGSEARNSGFRDWLFQFEYIVCDEM